MENNATTIINILVFVFVWGSVFPGWTVLQIHLFCLTLQDRDFSPKNKPKNIVTSYSEIARIWWELKIITYFSRQVP